MIYFVSILGFALGYHFISSQEWFLSFARPIFNGYASLGSGILNLFGQETNAVAAEIRSEAFSLAIKEGCDGITPMLLYIVSILAFPISLKYKWAGALLGTAGLFVLNVIRIVSLYFIGKNFSYEVFDFMHVDFWSVLFLLFGVMFWILWMRWALIKKKAGKKQTL